MSSIFKNHFDALFSDIDTESDADVGLGSLSEEKLPKFSNKVGHLYFHEGECDFNDHQQCKNSFKYFCPNCAKGLGSIFSKCDYCHTIDLSAKVPIATSFIRSFADIVNSSNLNKENEYIDFNEPVSQPVIVSLKEEREDEVEIEKEETKQKKQESIFAKYRKRTNWADDESSSDDSD